MDNDRNRRPAPRRHPNRGDIIQEIEADLREMRGLIREVEHCHGTRLSALELAAAVSSGRAVTRHDILDVRSEIQELGENMTQELQLLADAYHARMDEAHAAIAGLEGDHVYQAGQIAALQATQGTLTPEQRTIVQGMAARVDPALARLQALDALVQEPPPPAPPPPEP